MADKTKINLDYLDKVDECYMIALEDALAYKGNFKYDTTTCLMELLYLFKYRIKDNRRIYYDGSKDGTL
jgi:hypothetical protein